MVVKLGGDLSCCLSALVYGCEAWGDLSCCISALVYGCEAWADLSGVTTKLVAVEIEILKVILKVKKGTSSDIIFYELKRCNIIYINNRYK